MHERRTGGAPERGRCFFGRIRGIMGIIYYIIVTKVK